MTQVLGVKLTDISPEKAIDEIIGLAKGSGQHYVVTPNPELVLAAAKSPEYKRVLNGANLSLADGFGLVLAGLLDGKKIQRVTGSDATVRLLPLMAEADLKVLLINWDGGLSTARELESEITKRYSNLKFKTVDIPKGKTISKDALSEINKFTPDVLFLSLGAPWQEYIASSQLKLIPSAKVALCVGGSFEFILGKMKRAPKIFRKMGMEWLWRLLMQPKRIKRIWNAVVVFMFYVLLDKLKPGENNVR